jgi:nucleoside-diphosphate-sugar epimerase
VQGATRPTPEYPSPAALDIPGRTPLKVLVTGAAGYIGSVLCRRLLAEGHSVLALDLLKHGGRSLLPLCSQANFDFVAGDVRDTEFMGPHVKGADVIIPLAAVVGAPACDRDPLGATTVNLEAIQLINRLRSPAQLVLYPTTNSGYGTRSGDLFCTEDTPLQPVSLYGTTKVAAERELLDSQNAISLRLATVFGVSPRMRADLLVNHFTHAAVTDGYIVIFEKDFKRNYVHIEDVADCFIHAISNADRMVGRPFNVGLDEANLSKEELALKVKEHVPGFYIHFAEIGTDPDQRNYIVSNRRLAETGFTARRSIDQGIGELIKAYRLVGGSALANA